MEEMNQVIFSVIESLTRNNETCCYNLKDFMTTVAQELDSIFMRKFAKRVVYYHNRETNTYWIGIKHAGDKLLPEGNDLARIYIEEYVSHGKKCKVEYYLTDGTDFEFICERRFHPAVEKLAELMQKKLNARREKYSTQTWDTWRELNRVALLKHFDEECLEFKSELYKFINNPNIVPNAEEKNAMQEELADVANLGFMLIERILGGNTTVIPDNVNKVVCSKCGKEVKEQLAIKGVCYTCKKLELH